MHLLYAVLPPSSLLSVVMIQFDETGYAVSEGDPVSAEVQVMSGIVLDRSVIVTVQTVDGTATGMVVWLDVSGYEEEDHSLDV